MDNTKKNDRRISIVLNGKEKTFEEVKKVELEQKQIIVDEISAAKEETNQNEFEWVLPQPTGNSVSKKVVDLGERRRDKKKLESPYWDDGKSEASPKLPPSKRKQQSFFEIRSLPLGLIGIVVSAIVVGISFGLMMLTIFTGDKGEPIIQVPAQTDFQETVSIVPTLYQTQPLKVEIIQGGAFSTLEKGQEAAQVLKEKGYPTALIETTNKVFLFIGFGLNKEQATMIADQYKLVGQEVYVKPYETTAQIVAETEEQAKFLETSVQLFEQLASLTVNGFTNNGALLNEHAVLDLKTKIDQITSLSPIFNEARQQQATILKDQLTAAYNNITSYSSSKDVKLLWQAQQELLNGMISYEKLVN